MRRALCDILVDPSDGSTLTLSEETADGDDIVSGSLTGAGQTYAIESGIPRFVRTEDDGQLQTRDTFAYKWRKRDTYDGAGPRKAMKSWLVSKYGFGEEADMEVFFASRERVLDVGCGAGFSSSLWIESPVWEEGTAQWVGADISGAVDVARQRLAHARGTHFVQADALQLPFPSGSFDTVFSEGVLHHTPSTRGALLSASRVLRDGGEIFFYVYRRKGPIREFADDYIRNAVAPLSDEEAWEAMRSITHLGQVLSELDVEVELGEDVPLIGLKAGRHNLQRMLYYDFLKMYWNAHLSFEENVHVNFDWYRPRYAHRQSPEEVRSWCAEAGLRVYHFNEEASGFSVRAIKEKAPCAA